MSLLFIYLIKVLKFSNKKLSSITIILPTSINFNTEIKELKLKGHDIDYNALKQEIEQRDFNDKNRDFAPLKKADDAIEIDTSYMTIEQVINKVMSLLK